MVEAMEISKGFKKTEAGIIPNDWIVCEIRECTSYVDYRGSTPKKTIRGRFLVTAKNVKKGYIDYDISKEYVAEKEYEKIMRRGLPRKGDVLITTEAPLGNVASVDRDEIALAQRIIKYRTVDSLLGNSFFKHYLLSERFQKILDESSSGSTAKGIKGSVLHKLPVAFPPTKAEQTAIATALNDADALISSVAQLIAKKRSIKQGAMQELLKPKAGWEVVKLGDLLDLNPSKPLIKKEDVVVFLGMENVSEEGKIINQRLLLFSQIKKGLTFFKSDDVIVAKITPCFENGKGACLDALRTDYGFGSTEFHVLRTNETSIPRFVFYHTQSQRFRKQLESEMTGSAGQKRVPAKSIVNYQISIPALTEQTRIAQILSDMDAEIDALEKKLEKYRMIKQGMIQNLLTGRIRLV